MNDETQAKLINKLAELQFADANPEIRAELLDFFSQPDAPYATKKKPKEWAKVQVSLEKLKAAPAQPQVTTTKVAAAKADEQ